MTDEGWTAVSSTGLCSVPPVLGVVNGPSSGVDSAGGSTLGGVVLLGIVQGGMVDKAGIGRFQRGGAKAGTGWVGWWICECSVGRAIPVIEVIEARLIGGGR